MNKLLITAATLLGMFSFAKCSGDNYYFAQDGFFGNSPGKARVSISGNDIQLANNVIACQWSVSDKKLSLSIIEDKAAKKIWNVSSGNVFRLTMGDGMQRFAKDFIIIDGPRHINLNGKKDAPRFSDRLSGIGVSLSMKDSVTGIQVDWTAILREGSNYVRQKVKVSAIEKDQNVKELTLVDMPLENTRKCGLVDGSPLFADQLFTALEHPMAKVTAKSGQAVCTLERSEILKAGDSFTATSVIGVTSPGQSRRGFQYYIERERIHPYRQFLHYNSWYDIAYQGHHMNEKQCVGVINLLGQKLASERGVKIDSFVFDDGWDDFNSLWDFHKGFPNGFSPLKDAAAKYGTYIGTWISPWGGYHHEKKARIKYGKTQGFETNSSGFSLAGKNYNRRFTEVCENIMREYDLNYYKFDGIGGGASASGAPRETTADVEALLALTNGLHQKNPSLFINATVGTWPSPYLLFSVDSIWRQAADMGQHKSGAGTKRDKWITYRDGIVYSRIVKRSPYYPLNSLMYVGIAMAKRGYPTRLNKDPEAFRRDVRNFFATGTNCQELYITGSLFTDQHWDILAEAAKWARRNQSIMVDTHWVGGNPTEDQIYGYASWSPDKAILMLRNPSGEQQSIKIDLGKVFELPTGSPSLWQLKSAWKEDIDKPALQITAGNPYKIDLNPLEVMVLEAKPVVGSQSY